MTELARAEVVIGGDDGPLMRTLSSAEGSLKNAGRRMQNIGRKLSVAVTVPLAAIGAASTKAFADFDNAMTQSQAIMGDVSETMNKRMAAAARNVARTTTTSSTEAAESFFFLASAGLDAQQSVAALPQVAAFAQAGMFDMAKATDLATDAQSALGLASENATENLDNLTRVTDVLVKANTLANASVQQFSTALTSQAGAALRSFNIDVEEGTAVLAALADQGVKAEKAGMGLSRILRLMSQAATNNAAAMKNLGIRFFDATGNMLPLADVVENLTNVLGPMSDAQRAVALESIGFTARVQGMLLPLLGTSDAIREYEAGLQEAAGTTKEVADNQMKSFSAQMKVAKDNVIIAAQVIGEQLAPIILRVSEIVSNLAQRFAELSPATHRFAVVVGLLAGVLPPVVWGMGQIVIASQAILATSLASAVVGWVGAFVKLAASVRSVAGAVALLQVSLGPVGWLTLGVSALVGGFALWKTKIGGAGNALGELNAELRAGMTPLADFEKGLLKNIDALKKIEPLAKNLAEQIGDGITVSVESASSALKTFGDELSRIDSLQQALGPHFRATEERITATKNKIIDLIEDGVSPASQVIQRLRRELDALTVEPEVDIQGTAFMGPPLGALETLGRVPDDIDLSGAFEAATATFEEMGSVAENIAQTIGRSFTDAFNAIIDGTKSAAKAFGELATQILRDLAKMIARTLIVKAIMAAIGGPVGGAAALPGIPGFQHGGSFTGRRPFLVGERGPELVVPSGAGQVVSNREMQAGAGASAGSVAREILSAVGPLERPMTPREAARDRWWFDMIREVAQKIEERGP